jgi:hypothetical protein
MGFGCGLDGVWIWFGYGLDMVCKRFVMRVISGLWCGLLCGLLKREEVKGKKREKLCSTTSVVICTPVLSEPR